MPARFVAGLQHWLTMSEPNTHNTMRKIEAAMINAVRNGRDWHSGNTSVDVTDHGIVVRLHGNVIAQVDHENHTIYVTDAGWQTTTTKSRLNALLQGVANRGHIFQKDFIWYLERGGDAVEMDRRSTYAVSL